MNGGTKGDFTAEQFAQSIVYWNTHTMSTGKSKWHARVMKFLRRIQSNIREGGLCLWLGLPSRRE